MHRERTAQVRAAGHASMAGVRAVILVLTGVSGSGKTAVGRALAGRLGWAFLEGDDFHPPANVRRMESGRPLREKDRDPWLVALREAIADRAARGESAIVTCSCLRQRHRTRLRAIDAEVRIVHLEIDRATAEDRVGSRSGHYFGADLVASQFEALEEPASALVIDARGSIDEIVAEILARTGLEPTG